jgi:hypothetical protein
MSRSWLVILTINIEDWVKFRPGRQRLFSSQTLRPTLRRYVDYHANVGLSRRDGFDLGVVSPTLQNFLDTVLN